MKTRKSTAVLKGAVYGAAFDRAKRREEMEHFIPSSVTKEWGWGTEKEQNSQPQYEDNIEDIEF